MTREELYKEIQKKTKVTMPKVKLFFESLASILVQKAKDQEDILISGLGKFENRKRKPKKIRNLSQPNTIINVPERVVFKFFASPTLRKKIQQVLKDQKGTEINIVKNINQKGPKENIPDFEQEKSLNIKVAPSKFLPLDLEPNPINVHLYFKYIPEDVLQAIPVYLARIYQIIPIEFSNNILKVATINPKNYAALDFARRKTSSQVIPVEVSAQIFNSLLNRYGQIGAHPRSEISNQQPAGKSLRDILLQAVNQKANKIILEPDEIGGRVSFKITRLPQLIYTLNIEQYHELIEKIKEIGLLDSRITELPQENQINYSFDSQQLELDINIIPTISGEKCVIEISNKKNFDYNLDNIGILPEIVLKIKQKLSLKTGMFLIGGLPRAGKTTTVYAISKELISQGLTVVSYEDKVEKHISNMTQTEARPEIGAWGWLQAVIKIEPDAIVFGNINTPEEAKAAFYAASSGYLTIGSINAKNASHILEKLSYYKIDKHLIFSSLSMLIIQKSVPALCNERKTVYPLTSTQEKALESRIKSLPIKFQKILKNERNLYRAGECFFCETGDNKNQIIYEIINLDEEDRAKLENNSLRKNILEILKKNELLSLKEDALAKASLGQISYSDYLEVYE